MMQITNGVVEFERVCKTGDYENKKAKVSLSFTIMEGANLEATDQYVHNVSHLAINRVLVMVGERQDTVEDFMHSDVPDQIENPGLPPLVPKITRRGRPPKVAPAITAIDALPTLPVSGSQAGTTFPYNLYTLPYYDPDPDALPSLVKDTPQSASVDAVITDADLGKALAQFREHKASAFDPEKVTALIAKYAAPGFRMSDIPFDGRRAFLCALDLL
jgi:hypothetical protein